MADLVSEIISPEALKQLDDANRKLEKAAKNVAELAGVGKSIQFDFSGVKDLSGLNDLMAKTKATTAHAVVGFDDLKTASAKVNAVMAEMNGHSGEWISNLRKMEAAEAQTAKTRYENAKYARLLADEQARVAAGAEKEAAKAAKLGNEYEILKRQYKTAADEAKRLGAAMGVNSQAFKDASASAMNLHTRLFDIERAVGQSQRNVGNYSSAVMAMSQMLREAPAFAYSFSTGILALSNNIPILVDEITRLRDANALLRASGEKTIPIWKTLMSAITSPGGIITIATGAITLLAARMSMAGGGMSEAAKKAKELNDALKGVSDTIRNSLEKELTKTIDLFETAKDMGATYHQRISAINELLKLYPELLANITEEAFLNGQVAESQSKVVDIIAKKMHSEELTKQVDLMIKERDRLQKEINEGDNGTFAPMATTFRFITGGEDDPFAAQKRAIAKLNRDLQDSEDILKAVNKQLGYMQNPPHEGRLLADIDADIKSQEMLRDHTVATTSAHGDAIAMLVKLQEERKKYLGVEDKPKKSKDYTKETLKAEQDLVRAMAAEEAKRVQVEAEGNKTIADDENKSLNDRVVAYRVYSGLILRAKGGTIYAEIEANNLALAKIAEIEKKAVKDRTSEEKDLLLTKKLLLQKNATYAAEYNLELTKNEDDTQKAITKIYADEVQFRISELKKIKENNDSLMNDELKKAQEHYGNSLQSEKAYQEAVKRIKEKYAVQNAEQNVEFLKAQIDDVASQGGDVAGLTASLADAENKIKEDQFKKEEDRINKQKEMQKEVAAQAVKFAQEAASAIIQIQDQKYDAELNALKDKQDALKTSNEQEKEMIEASTTNSVDRQNKLSELAAKTQSEESAIEQQKKAIEIRKAKFDKEAAIAKIAAGIAVAEVEALSMLSNPITAPFYPAIAGLIAATGAAQLAVAANAPIPQYRYGTGNHPGGRFIAGDGGEHELITTPSGKSYWSDNKSKMYNEAAGTSVTPLHKIIEYMSGNVTNSINYTTAKAAIAQAHNNDITLKAVAAILGDKFEEVGGSLAYVISRSRPTIKNDNNVAVELRKERKLQ